MVNYVQFIENIQFPSNRLNQPQENVKTHFKSKKVQAGFKKIFVLIHIWNFLNWFFGFEIMMSSKFSDIFVSDQF